MIRNVTFDVDTAKKIAAKKIAALYDNTQVKLDIHGNGWYVLRNGWAMAEQWDDDIVMKSALGEDPFPDYKLSEL